ncbi:hypothetical protein PCC7418_1725 [Halothece sp. PCC 7418]|uniref:hypothetical protein n=1 Tax=Halothece sp. (strain PCC 7418) TaxID=65093 RepID=UPI0002A0898D|nr:hypothetical protein [Halothece sp. PCC 7418]AFZ43894.1 hypothetical protein PCC7418_1725 [Halothece sp. PCC 7418]
MEKADKNLPLWEYKVIHLNIRNTEAPNAEAASSATKGTFSPEFLKQEFPDIYSGQSGSNHPARQLQEALNRLGQEGWELFDIHEVGSLTMMFFKRLKPQNASSSEGNEMT